MNFLKQNTACEIIIGPILDCVDGKTPVETLTLSGIIAAIYKGSTRTVITLTASGGNNNLTYVADGYWKLTLTAANLDEIGIFIITLRDDDVFLPIFEDFTIQSEPVYNETLVVGANVSTQPVAAISSSSTGAQIIPLTNDGSRKVIVTTNAGILTFTTYYMPLIKSWLCDIEDSNGLILVTGLNLVVAVDNLLKGRNVLKDYTLRLFGKDGAENNNSQSLGNACQLVLFSNSEYIPPIYEAA